MTPVRGIVVLLALLGGVGATGCVDQEPELDPASVFEGVQRYRFAGLPPRFDRELRVEYGTKPHVAEHVTDTAVRRIEAADGQVLGTVVVVALDPEAVARPGSADEAVRGYFAPEDPPQEITLAGRPVLEGSVVGAGGFQGLAWREDNLVVLLFASEPDQARDVARAIMEA